MPPAVASDPPRQNPSGPEAPAAAQMANPRLGFGLAPPSADPSPGAPPPSRRAPRLAKRRHAAASSRSRVAPQAPAGTWNPFGAGVGDGTDGPRQDGNGGVGSAGSGRGQNGVFVFGVAPAVSQQQPPKPAASSSEAPFVFGSVRESLPRFEDRCSTSSTLPDAMGKLNLRVPGEDGADFGKGVDQKDGSSVFGVDITGLVPNSEVNVLPEKLTQLNLGRGEPLQSEKSGNANGVPKTFVFGVGSSADTTTSGHHSYASNSFQGAEEKVMLGKSTQFSSGNHVPADMNIGSDVPLHGMKGPGDSHQHEVFTFGNGGASGAATGMTTSSTSDRTSDFLSANSNASSSSSDFLSTANSNACNSDNGTESIPQEKTSDLNAADGVVNETRSSSSQSASLAADHSGTFFGAANTNTSSSSSATPETALPEKMAKLNIGCGTPFQSSLKGSATQPPEVYVFGTSFSSSSAQTGSTSFSSFQTDVPFQPKDKGRYSTNEDIKNPIYCEATSDQGYGPSGFIFGRSSNATACYEGAAEYVLHDEINKLNISSEGTSVGCTKSNDSSTPEFLFQSKAEATSGYGAVPQPKVQEPSPFTNSNHSSSFFTFGNSVHAFSFGTMNAERGTAPDDSVGIKQDLPAYSRETLFGLDSIKSAYRDKKEAHKSTRKKKKPIRLKQHSQLNHVVSQETCTNGEASDLAGDYSPMDCSPYPAASEHVSKEADVVSDQSVHNCDGDICKGNSSCAEDDLISATKHLIIDADLPTFTDEGRVLNADASENNFGSSFSSYAEDLRNKSHNSSNVNICTNDEVKTGTTGTFPGYGHAVNEQAYDDNTSRADREFGEAVAFQSSSTSFNELNFSFGTSLSPQSSLSAQRRNTRRKLRTKGGPASKPSNTNAFVQPKSSQDTKSMQLFPEKRNNENSVKEQSTIDAPTSAALEICETWRISGNKAYANGHFATAEDYYTRGINSISHPGASGQCPRALMLCYSNRAATRMSLGLMREALQDCLVATSMDPSFLKAKVRAANCQLALGDLEDASRSYMSCLDSNNSFSDPKIFAEASDGLERVKRTADWISQSKELLEKRTSSEATTALELISNALQISPFSDSLMEMKAEAMLMLRRYEEVIKLCQESVDPAERNSGLFSAGEEPSNVGVSKRTQCSIRHWKPYFICKSYFLSGNLEEARKLLKKHEEAAYVKESGRSTYQERFSLLSTTIRKLLSLKAAGNESFQAGRYSEAVEQYSTALAYNSESRPFSAVCFCNRAAAYQALGQVTDAIADCSLAMVLDPNYPKAISRRATLYEMVRDYGQASNDVRRLISLLENNVNKSGVSPKVSNKHSDLRQARARLSSLEDEAKKDIPLNFYLILGVESSCSPADIKKAYRKAALRHHPDKAAQLLVRNENADDGFWRDVAKEIHADADHLFKTIGEAYNVLSDPDKRQEYDIEEDLRNARKRVSKGRSMHRSPEQSYGNRGFNPRHWQSSRGSSRSRWYGYSDDYW